MRRTVLIGNDGEAKEIETIFCIDGREAYYLNRRANSDEIDSWCKNGLAPLEAESAPELEDIDNEEK